MKKILLAFLILCSVGLLIACGDPEAVVEKEQVVVSFYNSDKWPAVYAYAKNGTNEPFGDFPGIEASRIDYSDWYQVELEVIKDRDFSFEFTFSDGTLQKNSEVTINDKVDTFVATKGRKFNCTADAEEAVARDHDIDPDPTHTTVYFYNSNNWSEVWAYAFAGEGDNAEEFLGLFPGTQALSDTGYPNWYKIDVEVVGRPFGMVFSNGITDFDDPTKAQTKNDVLITSATDVYVNINGNRGYQSRQAAIDELSNIVTTTVYFYNKDNWDTVFVHAFISGVGQIGSQAWPGNEMISDGSGWFRFNVEHDLNLDGPFEVVFNNGSGEQTADLLVNDLERVYFTLLPNGYTSKAATLEAIASTDFNKPITIYFYNSAGHANISIYTYSPELVGSWNDKPLMQPITGRPGWFEYTFETNIVVSPPNIIIDWDGGDGSQVDVDKITDEHFVYIDIDGSLYDSFEAVEALHGGSTPEPDIVVLTDVVANPTNVYFYNADGWDEVYAYAFYGALPTYLGLGAWPGTQATLESDNWFVITINTIEVEDHAFTILFNNGKNGLDERKTQDIEISSRSNVYTSSFDDLAYDNKEEVEALHGSTPQPDIVILTEVVTNPTDVYFYNADGWDEVYAYAYYGSETVYLGLGEWPGMQATLESDNWFVITINTIEVEDHAFTILFNNGKSDLEERKTQNIEITSRSHIYTSSFDDLAYDNKEEVEALHGSTPQPDIVLLTEVVANPTDVYFYNADGWDNVYAYAYYGTEIVYLGLGEWPGTQVTSNEGKWFSITIETIDVEENAFLIVFNNGESELAERKSPNIVIDSRAHMYTSVFTELAYEEQPTFFIFNGNDIPASYGEITNVRILYRAGDDYITEPMIEASFGKLYGLYVPQAQVNEIITGFEVIFYQANADKKSNWINYTVSENEAVEIFFVEQWIDFGETKWSATLDLSTVKTLSFDGATINDWGAYWLRVVANNDEGGTIFTYNWQGTGTSGENNDVKAQVYTLTLVAELGVDNFEIWFCQWDNGHNHKGSQAIAWEQVGLIGIGDTWQDNRWSFTTDAE